LILLAGNGWLLRGLPSRTRVVNLTDFFMIRSEQR
jgi:hypothetical protein